MGASAKRGGALGFHAYFLCCNFLSAFLELGKATQESQLNVLS